MALIALRQLLDHAAENDYGVPAFNVNNLEQIQQLCRPRVIVLVQLLQQVLARNTLESVFEKTVKPLLSNSLIFSCMHRITLSPDVVLSQYAVVLIGMMMDGSLQRMGRHLVI